jgi:hypothetical protein
MRRIGGAKSSIMQYGPPPWRHFGHEISLSVNESIVRLLHTQQDHSFLAN